ncbi:MAG: adenylosuccinate synthetase [Candidatus Jordarchaeaceae archaeon]
MPCQVLVGGFFGDEGKGKIVSYLAIKDKPSICVRAGVGTNAGHTVEHNGKTYKLRQIPSGFVQEKAKILIGPGVLVNPEILKKEVEETGVRDRLKIDRQCAIIEQKHIEEDRGSSFLKEKIGSTGTGCGPCNAERAMRRVKLAKDVPELSEYITDVPLEVNMAIDAGENVLIEGTQGTFLSLYHGTYPFVTSKDTSAAQACADVGIGPTKVDDVYIVFKSFTTRVGAGELPGEVSEEEAKRRGWFETATVTGRKRRAAPFNFELAKRAVMLNGATKAAITKLDILYPECSGARSIDQLSAEGLAFVRKVEETIKIPVCLIGTGPKTLDIIDLRDEI